MFARFLAPKRKRLDRRQKIDPRFRNPNYPEFLDRRSEGERRYPLPKYRAGITSEHGPPTKTVWTIGVAATLILVILFFVCMFHLRDVPMEKTRETKKSLNPVVSF
ncbi:MAG: hypothetical protein KKB20_27295 [Proteobacteria bacterium]|nr:hypothetical protein [Pseudomonadota bacterium]